jgi:hypothetical protein
MWEKWDSFIAQYTVSQFLLPDDTPKAGADPRDPMRQDGRAGAPYRRFAPKNDNLVISAHRGMRGSECWRAIQSPAPAVLWGIVYDEAVEYRLDN